MKIAASNGNSLSFWDINPIPFAPFGFQVFLSFLGGWGWETQCLGLDAFLVHKSLGETTEMHIAYQTFPTLRDT